jgi:hypothetical protein
MEQEEEEEPEEDDPSDDTPKESSPALVVERTRSGAPTISSRGGRFGYRRSSKYSSTISVCDCLGPGGVSL